MSAPLRGSLNDVNVISLKRGENWNECGQASGQWREWMGVVPPPSPHSFTYRLGGRGGEERGEVTKKSEGGWEIGEDLDKGLKMKKAGKGTEEGRKEEKIKKGRKNKERSKGRMKGRGRVRNIEHVWGKRGVQAKVNWTTNVHRFVASAFALSGLSDILKAYFIIWRRRGLFAAQLNTVTACWQLDRIHWTWETSQMACMRSGIHCLLAEVHVCVLDNIHRDWGGRFYFRT